MQNYTKEEVMADIRKYLASGNEVLISQWTWSYGRIAFQQAVKELHAKGEIKRKNGKVAVWVKA